MLDHLKIFRLQAFPFFSLDPGYRVDQQPAQPAVGRHPLPRRLRWQAVALLAPDPTNALLPRSFRIQIPRTCHLLHLLEGKFRK